MNNQQQAGGHVKGIAARHLREIVLKRDLDQLAAFCVHRSYAKVIEMADLAGVDRDELEELLGEADCR